MIDMQLRIFYSKYSNGFMTSDILCISYRAILKKIEEADDEVEYNENSINTNTYSAALEWMLISTVIFIVKDDTLYLAKL